MDKNALQIISILGLILFMGICFGQNTKLGMAEATTPISIELAHK